MQLIRFVLSLIIICCISGYPALCQGVGEEDFGSSQNPEPSIAIYLDGQPLSLNNPLQIRTGVIYGPLREIFSSLGAEPSFLNEHERLIVWAVMDDALRFQFEAGTKIFYFNDTIASLPASTLIENHTLYIPLRFVLELCGYQIHWVETGTGLVQIHLHSPTASGEQNYAEFLPSHFTAKAHNVPVLMYHHILPAVQHDGSNGAIVSVEDFEEQMAYLYKNGYRTVGLADLYLFVQGKKALPERSVVITFDDGYRSNYDYAFPILQQYCFRAVQFPVTSFIEVSYSWLPHMNWEQMEEAAAVFEYHSHSHNLHYLVDEEPVMLVAEAEQIREDLRLSRELLDCFAFSYPFGVSSPEVIQILKETGYKMAFIIRNGNVWPGDDLFLLERRGVYPTTTLEDFSTLLKSSGATIKLDSWIVI